MAERLDAAQTRNLRLTEQLLTLQEEERTDLARDLHDEVGPFLFAVHLDAASIEQAVSIGPIRRCAGAGTRDPRGRRLTCNAMSARCCIGCARRARSRAALAPALDNLVAFWRARQPDDRLFELDVSVDEDAIGDPTMAAIYRLVQEGLNNPFAMAARGGSRSLSSPRRAAT